MTRKNLESRRGEYLNDFLEALDATQAEALLLYALPLEEDRERAVLSVQRGLREHPIVGAADRLGMQVDLVDDFGRDDLAFTLEVLTPAPITEVLFPGDRSVLVLEAGFGVPDVVDCGPVKSWELELREECVCDLEDPDREGHVRVVAFVSTWGGVQRGPVRATLGEFPGEKSARAMLGEFFPHLNVSGARFTPRPRPEIPKRRTRRSRD